MLPSTTPASGWPATTSIPACLNAYPADPRTRGPADADNAGSSVRTPRSSPCRRHRRAVARDEAARSAHTPLVAQGSARPRCRTSNSRQPAATTAASFASLRFGSLQPDAHPPCPLAGNLFGRSLMDTSVEAPATVTHLVALRSAGRRGAVSESVRQVSARVCVLKRGEVAASESVSGAGSAGSRRECEHLRSGGGSTVRCALARSRRRGTPASVAGEVTVDDSASW